MARYFLLAMAVIVVGTVLWQTWRLREAADSATDVAPPPSGESSEAPRKPNRPFQPKEPRATSTPAPEPAASAPAVPKKKAPRRQRPAREAAPPAQPPAEAVDPRYDEPRESDDQPGTGPVDGKLADWTRRHRELVAEVARISARAKAGDSWSARDFNDRCDALAREMQDEFGEPFAIAYTRRIPLWHIDDTTGERYRVNYKGERVDESGETEEQKNARREAEEREAEEREAEERENGHDDPPDDDARRDE